MRAPFLNRTSPPTILTLTLIAGLSALSMNVFLPSLPGMAQHFGASYALMQLSVTFYLAMTAALQIVIGPIADRYGRRPVLLGSFAIFLVATVGTIVAPTVEVFLVCRMAQAAVASGTVLSRAIVRDMVSGPEAASMIGYVTMGMSLVPMVGPILGGVLDSAFGWQANFAVLLLAGLGVAALVYLDLGETGQPGPRAGGQMRAFAALMRARDFWLWSLTAGFASGAFFAYLAGVPDVGARIFGLGSTAVGMLFAATAVGYMGGNFIAARFSVRMGMGRMVLAGTGITTVALALLAVLSAAGISGPVVFFALTLFLGVGNGMTLPNANAGIVSVRPDLAGTASGLGGAVMLGGGAALAALAGVALGQSTTELPLVLLMLASSAASIVTALPVARNA